MSNMVLEDTQKALITLWEEADGVTRVLYLVQPGFTVILVTHSSGSFEIQVFGAVNTWEGKRALQEQYIFSQGIWAPEAPNEDILEAVKEATLKAVCYHCQFAKRLADKEGSL